MKAGTYSNQGSFGARLSVLVGTTTTYTDYQWYKIPQPALGIQQVEMMFIPSVGGAGTIRFNIAEGGQPFYMDNIFFYQATATVTNYTDSIRFEYNATKVNKVVALTGSYMDVYGQAYTTGSATIAPYTSKILIKQTSTTVPIVKVNPVITWANPTAITYGVVLSGTQLNATATHLGSPVAGSFSYVPLSGTLLNAGTHNLTLTFTPTDQVLYNTVTDTAVIVVNKATATITLSGLARTYNGSPQPVGVTTSPAGLTVINVTYNGLGNIPINAGSHSVSASLNNVNYTATVTGVMVIAKATATITVSNTTQSYTGTPRSVVVTTSPINLAGVTVTYAGSPTPPTNVNSYAVVATLTHANYTAANVSTTLVINMATPVITWSTPANITYGTALSGTQLNATANVPGTFTYSPPAGSILLVGTHLLSLTFTPTDTVNYSTVCGVTVSLVVTQSGVATITLSNLNHTYSGSQKFATATTNPAGLSGVTITYNGSTTAPTNVGSYTVSASLNNPNYTAPTVTGTLIISKATVTILLSGLSQTYTGTSRTVTATTAPAGLTVVSITYEGSPTAPINAGSYAIVASLSNPNYQATNATGTLVVSKATPSITWLTPQNISYGISLSSTQLNATSGGVAGTFTYSPAAGTLLNVGTHVLSVNFVPTNTANYNTVNGTTVNITVFKATATISISNLLQQYDGAAKPVTITTNPGGLGVITVTYNGSVVVPSAVGSYTVIASLSNGNYTATNATGTLVISKGTATLALSNLLQTYDGTTQPVTVTTSPAGLTTVTVTYNGSVTVPTNAGTYTVVASLANANYTASNATGTLVIAKATPTVSWATPSAITYGTALSGTQLNAIASIAGTFTYTPVLGAILNAGTNILSVNFTPTDANYNSVNGTTVNLVVNKAAATIILGNLAQEYDGNPKTVTVTTSPVGLGVITVTYDGSATPPTAAGTYAVVASLANTNYTATNATDNLVISTSIADVTITNLAQIYDGSPKPVTVTVTGGWPYDVTYNGSATVPTNAGSYTVVATINDGIHFGSDTETLVIAKANPVINWANPTAITYGTVLSGTQLNASANTAGTFTYTPAVGTLLNAGTQVLSVSFVPTDAANYNSGAKTVSLTVNKAVATITLSNLTQAYDGTAKSVTATTSPVGLAVVAITYDGSATPPSAVGTYTVAAILTNDNYTATPAGGTLIITTSTSTVVITNISQIYTGSPLPVTVTVSGGWPTSVTYNASATVPTNAGTYTVIATINDGIHTGADTATYVIAKANPVVTWANPSAITYLTALSGTQLNATANVPGTFTYTPASGAILNAGTQPLSVLFVPTDAANYNNGLAKTVSIVVNKATATMTLNNLSQVYDGQPKPISVTTSPAGLATVTILYNGSSLVPTVVGSYTINASLNNANYTAIPATGTLVISASLAGITISNLLQTYDGTTQPISVTTNPAGLAHTITYNGSSTVPTNAGTYTVIATLTGGTFTGADTATLIIAKATPVVTWGNPTDIEYGTELSATQLNATASVPGTMTYLPAIETVLNVGLQSLSVTFTPIDAVNYNSVNKVVSIVVFGATVILELSGLDQVYDGLPKPVIVTSSVADLAVITVTYNGSVIVPTAAGSYDVIATLLNAQYNALAAEGNLIISKATPILSWAQPERIIQGTPLSAAQLNPTSSVAGTFTFNYPAGTVLPAGSVLLVATFTPTDATNYNSVSISVTQLVSGPDVLNYFITEGNRIFINLD